MANSTRIVENYLAGDAVKCLAVLIEAIPAELFVFPVAAIFFSA